MFIPPISGDLGDGLLMFIIVSTTLQWLGTKSSHEAVADVVS